VFLWAGLKPLCDNRQTLSLEYFEDAISVLIGNVPNYGVTLMYSAQPRPYYPGHLDVVQAFLDVFRDSVAFTKVNKDSAVFHVDNNRLLD
jgi:hypothetical protein